MATQNQHIYKEGLLLKRARGLHSRKNIKWQERYCRLTKISLDYYDPKKLNEPKGQFKLEQIRIVEVVRDGTFDRQKAIYPFQIGDNAEVMYLSAKVPQERNEWMEAFRLASSEKKNIMLPKHHSGVYGLTSKDRWSCCGIKLKEGEGCVISQGALREAKVDGRIRSQTTPIDFLDCEEEFEKKEDMSNSVQSDTSDSTITDEIPIKRTFSSLTPDMKRGILKPNFVKRHSILENRPSSPDVASETVNEAIVEEEEEQKEQTPAQTRVITPPQLDELTRSGASSPALSSDSGRGTSSRPGSMVTGEGDQPLTPRSNRSTFTTTTTDSDPNNKTLENMRPIDAQSIMSDASGLSSFSMSPHQRAARIRRSSRPQSVLLKDGISTMSDVSETVDQMMRLHQACKDGNLDVVKDELDTGAPIGGQEIFNGVPMLPQFIAFLYDHRHVVHHLLTHGADPNALDMSTRSCLLHQACQRGCSTIVSLLISCSADINMPNQEDNTPLCEASKNGHTEIVKILLEKNALIDFVGGSNSTPLHFAADNGHDDIVSLLLGKGADPLKKNQSEETPYHLAFKKGHKNIMKLLKDSLPTAQKPYDLIETITLPTEQYITSLLFMEDSEGLKLIAGSRDCKARIWSVSNTGNLDEVHEVPLVNTILSVASSPPFITLGSTSVQIMDSTDYTWRRTVADDSSDDECLEDPPLHHVAYTPDGHLVTAGVESDTFKIWPVLSREKFVPQPDKVLTVKGKKTDVGCLYRLEVSPNVDEPWLAAILQPGPVLAPQGNKMVHMYNWKDGKDFHIIDSGHGGLDVGVHATFSPDGKCCTIGCKENISYWENATGEMVLSTVVDKGSEVTSLTYSPDGYHLAVGLSNGDITVLDNETGLSVFSLRDESISSAVTALSYSKDGMFLCSGSSSGNINMWKVHNKSNCS